ncbi:nickel pincer cofactor biosynthesis protein LarC2 [Cohnella fermenti]|uniref:LarC family nickel insertion protein n=1 Tax=Cohnella fermenti TaxID=2565925 RepID=A0A4S4BP66_9BACL|nr:nickel insertion protein [Cohnella fermenti]THF76688.1 LarC family nickel insertion protein [Cohnella fermenti]
MFEGHKREHREDGMVMLQTNIDDMNPEFCPYVSERLLAAGAHDVFWIPILMKKGRPGLLLNVLTNADRLPAMESIVFEETTTLGMRYILTECKRLERHMVDVATPWGAIGVKVGVMGGRTVQFAPEYAHCEAAARAHGIPLKTVYEAARQAYWTCVQNKENKEGELE